MGEKNTILFIGDFTLPTLIFFPSNLCVYFPKECYKNFQIGQQWVPNIFYFSNHISLENWRIKIIKKYSTVYIQFCSHQYIFPEGLIFLLCFSYKAIIAMTSFTSPPKQLLVTVIIASKFCIYFDWNEIFLLLFMMKELFFLAFSICFRNIYECIFRITSFRKNGNYIFLPMH